MEIERVRGFLEAIKLKDDWLADMRRETLIKAVTKSITFCRDTATVTCCDKLL